MCLSLLGLLCSEREHDGGDGSKQQDGTMGGCRDGGVQLAVSLLLIQLFEAAWQHHGSTSPRPWNAAGVRAGEPPEQASRPRPPRFAVQAAGPQHGMNARVWARKRCLDSDPRMTPLRPPQRTTQGPQRLSVEPRPSPCRRREDGSKRLGGNEVGQGRHCRREGQMRMETVAYLAGRAVG